MNNQRTLLVASFMTLVAAGIGFGIRGGGILTEWETKYGFSKTELGGITGGGLTGFGVMIFACSLFVDVIGYKRLLMTAFGLHVLSAVVTCAAGPVYAAQGKDAAYWCLWAGMFIFALANGMCESVINPLVATLYPKQKTHYLNILHAGWPAGLIIGGLLAFMFVGPESWITRMPWEVNLCLFLIPTLYYGIVVLKEPFPLSEAVAAGVSYERMFSVFTSPILWFLLLLHAMIGYVELGTDSWISNIMANVINNSVLLLVYTSLIMFVLRFFAGPIVERINPVGLLLLSSLLGCTGLYWLSTCGSGTAMGVVLAAAAIYAVGKTFLWPTILGVVGERYPQGGALVMGAMGGIGMLSAGMLGGPVIGFQQDKYRAERLEQKSPEAYSVFAAKNEKGQPDEQSLFFGLMKTRGLDGKAVSTLQEKAKNAAKTPLTPEEAKFAPVVIDAAEYGGQMALRMTAIVPLCMAIGFGLLVIYFRMKGGYQAEELKGHHPSGEEFTGGVAGPIA